MTLDQLLERLKAVKAPGKGNGWMAPCPINPTHRLWILPWFCEPWVRAGCNNGCPEARIIAALGPVEPDTIDLEPGPPGASAPKSDPLTGSSEEQRTQANSNVFQSTTSRTIAAESNESAAAVVKPRRADLEAEIRRLHDAGLSHREVARRVQMHHTSVGRILKSSDPPLPEIRR